MISVAQPTLSERQAANKALLARFRAALYDCDPAALPTQLAEVFAPDCQFHLAHPLGDFVGPAALFERAYAPLLTAIPDLERRDFIVVGGPANDGADWIGCCGHYVGVFEQPWRAIADGGAIPPTLSMVAMRFHEFFRVQDGRVVEMQGIWDIPQLMLQAGAWPLAPSLGVEWVAPAPTTQDGIVTSPYDPNQVAANVAHVSAMLTAMGQHPLRGGPEVMALERFWHPKMCWYGPAGIGQMRRISGFRNWHQIPFLRALPDRRVYPLAESAMFGDGSYVAVTGWPDMQMTVTGGGWLGITPGNQAITMRSLDFWRVENGLIRENWVLIDLLDVYAQLGLDVFERMAELTHARQRSFTL